MTHVSDTDPGKRIRRWGTGVASVAAILALNGCTTSDADCEPVHTPTAEAKPSPEPVEIRKVELSKTELNELHDAAKQTVLGIIDDLEAAALEEYETLGASEADLESLVWHDSSPRHYSLYTSTKKPVDYFNKNGDFVQSTMYNTDDLYLNVKPTSDGVNLGVDFWDNGRFYRSKKTNKLVSGPEDQKDPQHWYGWTFTNPDSEWASRIRSGEDIRDFLRNESTKLTKVNDFYDEDGLAKTPYDGEGTSFEVKGKIVTICKYDEKPSRKAFLRTLDKTVNADY